MQSTTGSTGPDNAPAASTPGTNAATHPIFEFESFRLDPTNRLLTSAGKEVPLPGRAFDALHMLVRRPGDLVTKEELLSEIWAGSFVEESNLTVAISTLRRALNEDPQDRRYIQTVARRGYRFIAEVSFSEEQPRAARPIQKPPPTPEASPETSPLKAHPSATVPGTTNWPLFAVIAALVLSIFVGGWLLLRPREKIRTLAVLPFTLEGSSTANTALPSEVVLLGMTDELVSRLQGQLIVRPTGSVLRYSEGGTVDPVAAGREQNVDAVLTGVLENGREATLNLRLVRVRDGLTMWQNRFHGDWSNLPQVIQSAGNSAAAEIGHLGVSPPQKQPIVETTAPAYQLYLRGRYFWNRRTVDGLRKSVDYFRQSIAADPNYAPAYAGLADSYALLASFSVEPGSSANADARSAAFSAIHLDPTLAEPHASLGMVLFFTDWNLTAAEGEFERAIQLNPNYATAHHWYSLDLAAMGRFPQALYEIRLAQKLDPLSLIIGTNVGWIEYLARDYPAATHDLNRVLELDPHFARARTRLGMVEMAVGNYNGAVSDLSAALALSTDPQPGDAHPAQSDPYVEGLLGDAQARAGNSAAASKTLADLRQRTGYVPPVSLGLVLLGLGRTPEALSEFNRSIDDHSTSMVYTRVDPALDPLRQDPAFATLLARARL